MNGWPLLLFAVVIVLLVCLGVSFLFSEYVL